ncbi:T9SS type A sorting domain-containing protein [Joostella atrarenae]|uniref:T9SS type A sorting domain-containing protein n=1 Tax=Joostella atrarenae TaxID=679257 RepID=A0ABS9J2R1_9FLAO|nr:T9SS type A sorting domain-containing protein [Joostella atrarenae]MCF8714711.1 T9SS type A sorting domain-containing protein [Joostella atrarenae]
MKQFWQVVAPRYKDNPNVIYEITNEPLFNFTEYYNINQGDYYNTNGTSFKNDLLEIYDQVRADAPERQVIMFSFNGIHQSTMENAINAYRNDIDWDKTSVGYHMYQQDNGQLPRKLSRNYRMICTEWDYANSGHSYVKTVDGYEENSQTLELYQHSWLDWSSWNDVSLNSIDNYLIPDATSKGYKWWNVAPTSNKKITFRAKGTSGTENVRVLVNNQVVQNFSLSNQLDNYTTTTPLTGDVKLEFTNNSSGSTNVHTDYLAFGDMIKDSEEMVENTGVYQNGSCGGMLSDKLNCSGYINYGEFSSANIGGNYNVTVRAKGITGQEKIRLLIGSLVIKEWRLTNSFVNYVASTNLDGEIKIQYINDTETGGDVQVDFIELGAIIFQAEDMPTNTGVWTGTTCGGIQSCNGYIAFPSRSASQSLDYNITIRAKGINSQETIRLLVGDILINEWTLTSSFFDYTATTNLDGIIKVQYINDTESRGDVQIDNVKLGITNIYEAEDMPTNTGVWTGTTCGGLQSEFMHCNGFIAFPSRFAGQSVNYNVTVRSKGVGNQEIIRMFAGNVVIGEWTLTNSFVDYTATTNLDGTIKVQYVNDAQTGGDVQVDYVKFGSSTIYEAEDMSTNTGVWTGTTCGGLQSEFLHCNGYIAFPSYFQNTSKIDNSTKQFSNLVDVDSELPLKLYPNPVSINGNLYFETIHLFNDTSIKVMDVMGNIVYTGTLKKGKSIKCLNLRDTGITSSGLYFIRFDDGMKTKVNKVLVR